MKKLIISSVALLIVTGVVFAQKTGVNQNLSQKERMKMQVMKTSPAQANSSYFSTTVIKNNNLSPKEVMKTKIAKLAPTFIRSEPANISGICPSCLALSNLSPKEKMKAQTVGVYKCSMTSEVVINKLERCPVCRMALTAKQHS